MKSCISLLLLLITMSVTAPTCSAQTAGDAGIFADSQGTQNTLAAAHFVPFNVHAVAFDLELDVLGYEFTFVGLEGLTVLASSFVGAVNSGDVEGEYIVGTGSCLDGSGAFLMATLQVGSFTGADLTDKPICMRGANPSSFPAFSDAPGYLRCDGTLRPFTAALNECGIYPSGCLILNATQGGGPIPVETSGFGLLKAGY